MKKIVFVLLELGVVLGIWFLNLTPSEKLELHAIKQLGSDFSNGNIKDQMASIDGTKLVVMNKDKSQENYE